MQLRCDFWQEKFYSALIVNNTFKCNFVGYQVTKKKAKSLNITYPLQVENHWEEKHRKKCSSLELWKKQKITVTKIQVTDKLR